MAVQRCASRNELQSTPLVSTLPLRPRSTLFWAIEAKAHSGLLVGDGPSLAIGLRVLAGTQKRRYRDCSPSILADLSFSHIFATAHHPAS